MLMSPSKLEAVFVVHLACDMTLVPTEAGRLAGVL